MLIEAPGHVGLLLIPEGASPRRTEIQLKPIETWGGETLSNRSTRTLNEILFATNDVYRLLQAKQGREAMARVDLLQRMYPKLAFFEPAQSELFSGDGRQLDRGHGARTGAGRGRRR